MLALLLICSLFRAKPVEKQQSPVMVTETWRCGVANGGLQALCGQVIRARQEVIGKSWLFPDSSLSWVEGGLALIQFFKIFKPFRQWLSCISIELSVGSSGPFIHLQEIVTGRAASSKHLLLSDLTFRDLLELVFDLKFNCWQHQGQSSARLVCSFNTEYFMLVAEQWLLACRRCLFLKHAGLKELVDG